LNDVFTKLYFEHELAHFQINNFGITKFNKKTRRDEGLGFKNMIQSAHWLFQPNWVLMHVVYAFYTFFSNIEKSLSSIEIEKSRHGTNIIPLTSAEIGYTGPILCHVVYAEITYKLQYTAFYLSISEPNKTLVYIYVHLVKTLFINR